MTGPITLDGSAGGGAMLRVALALSSATGKPFRMTNIRASRPQPGLKQQHITGIRTLQELTGAKVTDCFPGSNEILFIPGTSYKKTAVIDAKTAAPITLILQSLLPTLIFHKKSITLTCTAGTDVLWSPQIDYFTNVFAPLLEPLATIKIQLTKRGYFPKGQGVVKINIVPRREPEPLQLTERGHLLRLAGKSHASSQLLDARVAERQLQAARMLLSQYASQLGDYPVDLAAEYSESACKGSGITVWAHFSNTRLGADRLGKLGIAAEKVGEEATKQLLEILESDAVVDSFMADQLIPYLALYGGELTTNKITNHTHNNIHICEQFLDTKFSIEGIKISASLSLHDTPKGATPVVSSSRKDS